MRNSHKGLLRPPGVRLVDALGIGMPRLVIRFSTVQAILALVLWAGRVRARRLLPVIAL